MGKTLLAKPAYKKKKKGTNHRQFSAGNGMFKERHNNAQRIQQIKKK